MFTKVLRAAEELCVTQGAVSHQVKALEAELSVKLFNRERQRLLITEAGRAVASGVAEKVTGGFPAVQRETAPALTLGHVCLGSMLSKKPQPASRLISCRKTKHAMIARRDALRPVAKVTGKFISVGGSRPLVPFSILTHPSSRG